MQDQCLYSRFVQRESFSLNAFCLNDLIQPLVLIDYLIVVLAVCFLFFLWGGGEGVCVCVCVCCVLNCLYIFVLLLLFFIGEVCFVFFCLFWVFFYFIFICFCFDRFLCFFHEYSFVLLCIYFELDYVIIKYMSLSLCLALDHILVSGLSVQERFNSPLKKQKRA